MMLKSMRLPAEGTLLGGPEAVPLRPEFPYGMRLDLDEDALKLLGISDLPEVGSSLSLQAKVVVVAGSENMEQGKGVTRRLSLQITDMALIGSGIEKEGPASVIYSEDS